MSLSELDGPTRLLVSLAAAIALGEEASIDQAARVAIAAGVPSAWGDELILQSVLICGWPRALTGARLWRQAGAPLDPETEDATDYRRYGEWKTRGEATCRKVYGETYDALRRNIHAMHPALETGMIIEGYGRILGRPALDLVRRELCTIAQIAVQGARRQLRSHLKGALNAGASVAVVDQVLALVSPLIDPDASRETMLLWERVRA